MYQGQKPSYFYGAVTIRNFFIYRGTRGEHKPRTKKNRMEYSQKLCTENVEALKLMEGVSLTPLAIIISYGTTVWLNIKGNEKLYWLPSIPLALFLHHLPLVFFDSIDAISPTTVYLLHHFLHLYAFCIDCVVVAATAAADAVTAICFSHWCCYSTI